MRIKQLLVNNKFPNQIVDLTIKNFLARKFANSNINLLRDETDRTAKPTVNAETSDDETAKITLSKSDYLILQTRRICSQKNNSR